MGVDNDKESNTDNGLEFNDNSNASNSPKYENDLLFDSNDDATMDNEGTEETTNRDSGYNSNWTNITITKDTNDYFIVEVNGTKWPVRQSGNADELNEFGEARRKYKVLYYEDIYL